MLKNNVKQRTTAVQGCYAIHSSKHVLTVSEYNPDQWYGNQRQTHYWLCTSVVLSLSSDFCMGIVIIASSGSNK